MVASSLSITPVSQHPSQILTIISNILIRAESLPEPFVGGDMQDKRDMAELYVSLAIIYMIISL